MTGNKESNYWLNAVLDSIEKKYPEGEIIISSGIATSASYHIGHFREILSANMISVGLEMRKRTTKHLHVVDNFDPLRKRYEFLPKDYQKYVGWPVCLIPDPKGCHDSYAEHYFEGFYKWIKLMDLEVDVIRSYQDLYQSGKMAPQIEKSVESIEKIRSILKKLSNRDLEDDWMPLQILGSTNNFQDFQFSSMDKNKQTIIAMSNSGEEEVSYKNGQVKLNWRLDWPARWQILGVMVEPHGLQELGAAGGAFETGLKFAREVFDFEGPIPGFQYGHVHLPGDNFKMSSSKNNFVTPKQAFMFMPPEVLRYFYARYPGKKKIIFDPGIGFIKMMDEYSQVDQAERNGEKHEFAPAYRIANTNTADHATSSVPFSHLVSIYQAALGDNTVIMNLLKRSGYANQIKTQKNAIMNEIKYVKNWLSDWAPDDVKFEIQKTLPDLKLDETNKKFLAELAKNIKIAPQEADGQWFHSLIHEKRELLNLSARDAFQTIYKVLLNKDSGPKAGWFLSILDKEFLVSRFNLDK